MTYTPRRRNVSLSLLNIHMTLRFHMQRERVDLCNVFPRGRSSAVSGLGDELSCLGPWTARKNLSSKNIGQLQSVILGPWEEIVDHDWSICLSLTFFPRAVPLYKIRAVLRGSELSPAITHLDNRNRAQYSRHTSGTFKTNSAKHATKTFDF